MLQTVNIETTAAIGEHLLALAVTGDRIACREWNRLSILINKNRHNRDVAVISQLDHITRTVSGQEVERLSSQRRSGWCIGRFHFDRTNVIRIQIRHDRWAKYGGVRRIRGLGIQHGAAWIDGDIDIFHRIIAGEDHEAVIDRAGDRKRAIREYESGADRGFCSMLAAKTILRRGGAQTLFCARLEPVANIRGARANIVTIGLPCIRDVPSETIGIPISSAGIRNSTR